LWKSNITALYTESSERNSTKLCQTLIALSNAVKFWSPLHEKWRPKTLSDAIKSRSRKTTLGLRGSFFPDDFET